jgi:hypothetical protein
LHAVLKNPKPPLGLKVLLVRKVFKDIKGPWDRKAPLAQEAKPVPPVRKAP